MWILSRIRLAALVLWHGPEYIVENFEWGARGDGIRIPNRYLGENDDGTALRIYDRHSVG